MWFQPIECDNTVKKPLVCDKSNIADYGFDEYDFKVGKSIDNWPEGIIFRATEQIYEGTPDDALQSASMIPIYSQRVKDKLESAEIKGIQYLPVEVQGFNGQRYSNFYIANFTDIIEALDLTNSDYSRFPDDFPNPHVRGKISRVRKHVLIGPRAYGYDIFRIAEYNQTFFVNEKFHKIFRANKFSGYSFRKVSVSVDGNIQP